MEFIKSINLIRKQLAYPFYMLLIFVPLAMTGVIYISLRGMDLEWEWNIYFIAMTGFFIGTNLTFWCKCHYQRLNQFEKAKWVVLAFDAIFLSIGLVFLLLP
ncbi:hypothetical protein VYA_41900 (plasmid) [Vibrio alfacsensis]|uniref:hypothetical protein n=1 Tax=Vibrio TaxID=662 RepID=UPI00078BCF0A|nr:MULTISPECIES: hypothetical protein [Vibrio]BAU70915.1 hypothetical protein [Vibrio sp. 04Ya108]BBM67828.1 hypothetical protein VA249_44740 [Vibrio alfacsensis]BCN26998.1 hypothetical protein VYA_41900 [Vibrio alfacsensis]